MVPPVMSSRRLSACFDCFCVLLWGVNQPVLLELESECFCSLLGLPWQAHQRAVGVAWQAPVIKKVEERLFNAHLLDEGACFTFASLATSVQVHSVQSKQGCSLLHGSFQSFGKDQPVLDHLHPRYQTSFRMGHYFGKPTFIWKTNSI